MCFRNLTNKNLQTVCVGLVINGFKAVSGLFPHIVIQYVKLGLMSKEIIFFLDKMCKPLLVKKGNLAILFEI